MGSLVVAARLVVAAVLAVAAVQKVAGRVSLRAQLRGFGIPDGLTGSLVVLLPLAELLVAILLVALVDATWPAWLAFALLGAFTALVGVNLARGLRVPCPCFGAARAVPISAWTIARNGWLLALALIGTGSTTDASVAPTLALTLGLGAMTVVVLRSAG